MRNRPECFYAGFQEEWMVMEEYDRLGRVGGKCWELGYLRRPVCSDCSVCLLLQR